MLKRKSALSDKMALEKKFIKEGIRNMDVEELLAKEFARAGYSHCEIQRTPLSIRITVYAHKPGLIIGRGGKNIESMTQVLKEKFGFENPQMDVQEVSEPDLDPFIVSKWIANSIERGLNYKRVVNMAIERIMSAGAAGVGIRVGGKIGSDISRVEKFSSGYLKFSGDITDSVVRTAYAQANVKLGIIGIQVRILPEKPEELEIMSRAETVGERVEVKPVKEKVEEKVGEKIGDNKEEAIKANESS
jgi:small subunit ribosomal protein S3